MASPERVRELLQQALVLPRTQAQLAEALGVTPQALSQAMKRGQCSAPLAASLHRWSAGKISKHELRPDVFGPGARQSTTTMEAREE